MVPTTRNLLLHHDVDGKSSRGRPCYHPAGHQYYVGIAAQLEASAASAAWQQDHQSKPSRSPRLLGMADDDEQPDAAAGPSTSSASPGGAGAGNGRGGDWLQLGLAAAAASASSSGDNSTMDPDPPAPTELELSAYDKRNACRMRRPPLFPLPLRSYHPPYGYGRYRPAAAAASRSMPFMPPSRCSSSDAIIRVISPPRRRTEAPRLWLTLQAAPNQSREPVLPQIAKSYLRIKDSNMTVEVVMKYLAEKLGVARSRSRSRSHQPAGLQEPRARGQGRRPERLRERERTVNPSCPVRQCPPATAKATSASRQP
ncbi:protein LAX PANICLE 2 isoform X5 [Zea mays]|uniref:RING finger protein n=1 Tax=Zea mays TaxID=4577 RepID=A0A804N865_MAIZE|nr:protein LAX PANICLE 2 isoform X5 [Zea mays]XP_008674610.1 protein LAX PANICLE 2 isoform X5 [Zea mays]|eukprot:XP_008674609.1 uncharacterized LOC103650813 isoform X5 [Zea mays]